MFKTSQAMLGALAAIALAAPVHAISVAGITWDATSPFDFQSNSANIRQVPGDPLIGFGRIDFINTSNDFCVNGLGNCELTFVFGAFNAQASNPNPDGSLEFNGGFVEVFVDNSPDFDINNAATAGNGTPWLSLVGASIFGADPVVSNLDTTLLATFGGVGATGVGALHVTGGPAAPVFDGNLQFGGADFEFQNSFTAGSQFTLGSGNFFSATVIPEPSILALMGLGLVGIGASRIRIRKV